MNPRQRQGLLLVVLSAFGLVAVFVLVANYAQSLASQVGDKITVVELAAQLNPYQPLSPNMLTEVTVPRKWAPPNAVTDPSPLIGLVSRVPLPVGTELEQGMLSQAPSLTPGHREIAVLVDAETGVANQIQPGDLVDIIATFQGSGNGGHNYAEVVVPSAQVLEIGQLTGSGNGSVPVTFSLTPADVLKVSYAESFAQKVRLSKVAPGSGATPVAPPPYSAGP
jgi:pilus assembly protein CpaB